MLDISPDMQLRFFTHTQVLVSLASHAMQCNAMMQISRNAFVIHHTILQSWYSSMVLEPLSRMDDRETMPSMSRQIQNK